MEMRPDGVAFPCLPPKCKTYRLPSTKPTRKRAPNIPALANVGQAMVARMRHSMSRVERGADDA